MTRARWISEYRREFTRIALDRGWQFDEAAIWASETAGNAYDAAQSWAPVVVARKDVILIEREYVE